MRLRGGGADLSRPAAILAFERLFLASVALGGVQAWIGWDELRERAGAGEMLALLGLTFATLTGLVLLVSLGRSGSAKWVLLLLCAMGLPMMLGSYLNGNIVGSLALALLQAVLQVGSLALLFTPAARKWLAGGG
ncbi:MAG TPA: hypothetical protein VEZ20_13055 [Allosphingosinicella sp.]|nr:hypothetical protein [Allosphingosinicella sp.]